MDLQAKTTGRVYELAIDTNDVEEGFHYGLALLLSYRRLKLLSWDLECK